MPSLRLEWRQALIGQSASVKVRIDGHVVAEALGRREQRVELDLLDGFLFSLAALCCADGLENLIVRERRQLAP